MSAERKLSIGFSGMPNPLKEMADLLKDAQDDGASSRSSLLTRALYYGSAPGPVEDISRHQNVKPSRLAKILLAVGGAAVIALAFGQTATGKIAKK